MPKIKYQPPQAVNLHFQPVHGQVQPQGICQNGSTIQTNITCTYGNTPTVDPATCSPTGANATLGGCAVGSYAETRCAAGSGGYA